MNPNAKKIRLAALLGFLAVALGAFGAHGLDETLKAHGTVEIWKTASQYHLIHAVVLLVLAFVGGGEGVRARGAVWCFVFGFVLIGASVFLLGIADPKWLFLMRFVVVLLLINVVALLVAAYVGGEGAPAHIAWLCIVFGIVIFSGSLYMLAVTNVKWLGAITPFGGVYLLIGWLLLAVRRWPRAE